MPIRPLRSCLLPLVLCAGCAVPTGGSAPARAVSAPLGPDPVDVQGLLREVATLRTRNHQLRLENEVLQAWENRTPTVLALHAPPGVTFRVVVEQGRRRSVIAPATRSPWPLGEARPAPIPGLPSGPETVYFDISDALRPGRNVIRISASGADDASASLWHLRAEGSIRARALTWGAGAPREQTIDFWVSPYAAQAKG